MKIQTVIRVIFFLLLAFRSFSQTLELTGKIYHFELNEKGKIYYTAKGKPFDKGKYIEYNKNKGYKFTIPVEVIVKEAITVMVFSIDPDVKSDDQNDCTYGINVLNIVRDSKFANVKKIRLKCDLILDLYCVSSEHRQAKEDGKEHLIGRYELRSGDTITVVNLQNGMYRYEGYRSKMNSDCMMKESGTWKYDESKKLLILYVQYQMNDVFGLILNKQYSYEFDVKEDSDRLYFSAKKVTLKKEDNKILLSVPQKFN